MANGLPIAFRAAGAHPVYVLSATGKVWIRGTAEATASGVDLNHLYTVDPSHGWLTEPTRGQVPSAAALSAYLAQSGDTEIP